jgi:hypothetical protein
MRPEVLVVGGFRRTGMKVFTMIRTIVLRLARIRIGILRMVAAGGYFLAADVSLSNDDTESTFADHTDGQLDAAFAS